MDGIRCIVVIITILNSLLSVDSGACHFPKQYYISDKLYSNILSQHPIVKYSPTLKFGVVYNDYHVFSSLYQFASQNVDRWRRKTVEQVIEAFNKANYGNSFISMCSCAIPIKDGRYCCAEGDCYPGCVSCDGGCIGSNDYLSDYSCDDSVLAKNVMTFYSLLNNTHNNLHRTRKKRTVSLKFAKGKPPSRIQPPRECKNKVCPNDNSSSSKDDASDKYGTLFDECAIQDAKITDRYDRDRCKQWCTPKVCTCKYTRINTPDSKYHVQNFVYRCIKS